MADADSHKKEIPILKLRETKSDLRQHFIQLATGIHRQLLDNFPFDYR